MQVLKDDVREGIIRAAAEEFYEKGYRRASMRNIAKRAGAAFSNMYNYFESKERLFCEIAEPVSGEIAEILGEAVSRGGGAAAEFAEYADKLAGRLARLSEGSRKAIVILMEKSEGTKFERTKEETAKTLEAHFKAELGAGVDGCAYRLIASNFISGMLGIIKEENGRGESLRLYLKYHLGGISALKRGI